MEETGNTYHEALWKSWWPFGLGSNTIDNGEKQPPRLHYIPIVSNND
jgi:hypothetical protein